MKLPKLLRQKMKKPPKVVEPEKPKKPFDICGAKKKDGTICKSKAGMGTHHPGKGRCKYHGGLKEGTDPQLLMARKAGIHTGQFEKIYGNLLSDNELEIARNLNQDKLEHIKEEIILTTIRERRMMARIDKLRKQKEEIVISGKLEMEGVGSSENNEGGGLWTQVHVQYKSVTEAIHAIEEALTKVQVAKTKQIELLHKLDNGGAGETSAIDKLVARWEKEAAEFKNKSMEIKKEATVKVTFNPDEE